MPACLRLIALGVALAGLTGCATAAMNAALRAAHPEPAWNGEVAVAPATVQLTRSHAVLEVRCQSEGYLETVVLLRPADDPAVFRMAPNGIIGATATVFSLASARTLRYPGVVTIAMVPAVFPDEETRTQFFNTRREAILATRAAQLALADERCNAQPDATCDPAGMVLRREQEEDLARLDRQHQQAQVATGPLPATGDQVAETAPAR